MFWLKIAIYKALYKLLMYPLSHYKNKYRLREIYEKISIIFVLLFLAIFSFIVNEPLINLDELWNFSFSKI